MGWILMGLGIFVVAVCLAAASRVERRRGYDGADRVKDELLGASLRYTFKDRR
jgi:hypothetical protein